MNNILKHNLTYITGFILLLPLSIWSQKTVYSTAAQVNCVFPGEELTIFDNRSDEDAVTGSTINYVATYSAIARLRYTRELLTDVAGQSWSYRVTYDIEEGTPGTTIATGQTLTLQLSPTLDNIYIDENLHPIASNISNPQIRLVITDVAASGDGLTYHSGLLDVLGIVPQDVYLELDIETERYDELANSGADNISITWEHISTGGNLTDIEVRWRHLEGAETYELEWLFLDDNFTGTFSDDLWKNAVGIQTQGHKYVISNTYPAGVIHLRMRAIGRHIDGVFDEDSQLFQGRWWNLGVNQPIPVDNFNPDMSWQFQTSYAEEGKNKKVISFFDEGLKNRQTTTNLSTEEVPLRATTHYDHEGRPVVNVLPAPDLTNMSLSYIPDFNNYSRDNFDRLADPDGIPTSSGASLYYSSANARTGIHSDYIPDAQNYPFTQSKYLADGTGRMKAQSGVGAPYKIGSGHETLYFYDDPSEMQLRRLFGKNVGTAKYYKRNLVQDANGQFSVSYVDAAGRTIATALAGQSPANVINLDSEEDGTALIIENIMDNNVSKETDLTSTAVSTVMNDISGTDLVIHYTLDAVADQIDAACIGCKLEVIFHVYDPCGGEQTLSNLTNTMDISDCGAPLALDFSENVVMELVGLYTISKELRVIPRTAQEWHDALEESTLLPDSSYFYNIYITEIDTAECSLDCQTYCAEVVQSRYGLTEESPGYQDSLLACVFRECGDELFREGSLVICDAILARIIQQIQPGGCQEIDWTQRKSDINALTFMMDGEEVSGDMVYPFIIQEGYQWQTGWADTLAQLHPEYDCTFLNCKALADSRYFDYTMPISNRWSEVSGGNHSAITGSDPFFTDGFGIASDMTSYLETYGTNDNGHPLDGIDPNAEGCGSGTADLVQFIECIFQDSTSAFKWSYYVAAYAYKKTMLLADQENTLCGGINDEDCTVQQVLPDLFDNVYVDDAIDWTESGIEESCVDFCAGQSEYIINQIVADGCIEDANFEELRNLLNVHCIDNCDFSNPFGYFTEEQRILPSYIAIESWLSGNGCSAEIFTEELTYYWDSIYVEGGRFKDAGISVIDTLCLADSLDMYFFHDSLYRNSLGLSPMTGDTGAF